MSLQFRRLLLIGYFGYVLLPTSVALLRVVTLSTLYGFSTGSWDSCHCDKNFFTFSPFFSKAHLPLPATPARFDLLDFLSNKNVSRPKTYDKNHMIYFRVL